MATSTCSNCNHDNESTRYFCAKCVTFLEKDLVSDENVFNLPEMKVMRILDNLKHVPHHKTMWDDTLDLFERKVRRVEQMEALYGLDELASKKNHVLSEKMDEFMQKCINPEFQIAFVGTIKTGKSTLINALLGHNYASMAVTPETAALTKFHASEKDFINVSFYNSSEWEKLWASRTNAEVFIREWNELGADSKKVEYIDRNSIYKELSNEAIEEELERWSSSKSAEHYFVKEIEVGISSLGDFPKQVVFVDTPGLSDPVAYRSEITQSYIKKADAVFMCVDAQKIQRAEIETIAGVFSTSSQNKDKVHIIATHWDKMNRLPDEWNEQKEYLEGQLTGKGFYETKKMASTHIMHAAAYIANLCREYDNLNDDDNYELEIFAKRMKLLPRNEPLTKSLVPEISKLANIGKIRSVIDEKLSGKYRDLLMEKMENLYEDIIEKTSVVVAEGIEKTEKLIEATFKNKEEIERKIYEQHNNYNAIKEESAKLNSYLASVKKQTQARLDYILPKLDDLAKGKTSKRKAK